MKEHEVDEKICTFFDRLNSLDSGSRARLKRSAGGYLNEARREALGVFYRVLPAGVPEYQHEIYFLAATLYPSINDGGQGDFGASLRRARQGINEKGLDRRVQALLDADEAQLPFRLRQAIQYLKSQNISVNWPRLLEDLLNWNHPARFVQLNWAKSYFYEEVKP